MCVLINYQNQQIKSLVIQAFWEQVRWNIEGIELLPFPDISPINLEKKYECRLLIAKLRQSNILYWRVFPFKLIVDIQEKKIKQVSTIQEAKKKSWEKMDIDMG